MQGVKQERLEGFLNNYASFEQWCSLEPECGHSSHDLYSIQRPRDKAGKNKERFIIVSLNLLENL